MSIASRLKKLERSAGVDLFHDLQNLPPPEECPEEIWQRGLELMVDYPGCVQNMVTWFRGSPTVELRHLTLAALECLERAAIEAETGVLPPDSITTIRGMLARIAEMSEEELLGIIREHDGDRETCRLPPPYTYRFLRELDLSYVRRYGEKEYELKRGLITEAEYDAELAKFLPPINRANLEKVARAICEQELEQYVL